LIIETKKIVYDDSSKTISFVEPKFSEKEEDTYLILFAIALIIIFTMYTAYKLMGLEPLGGKGSGLKYGAFLLTIIGYSLPLLNMFPWFMVWAGAVWLKPK
jgi:hypothetical protein